MKEENRELWALFLHFIMTSLKTLQQITLKLRTAPKSAGGVGGGVREGGASNGDDVLIKKQFSSQKPSETHRLPLTY